MPVRIALPKGRLLSETASLLEKAGWQLAGYDASLRNYRPTSAAFPDAADKGLPGERYPYPGRHRQLRPGHLRSGLDRRAFRQVCLDSAHQAERPRLWHRRPLHCRQPLPARPHPRPAARQQTSGISIASEYPNIAESCALNMRLRRFSIFPVWGGADAYPPETATFALVTATRDGSSLNNGLASLAEGARFQRLPHRQPAELGTERPEPDSGNTRKSDTRKMGSTCRHAV